MSNELTNLVWKSGLKLPPSERVVLLYLAFLTNEKINYLCCPKVNTIAKECNLSKRQTIRILNTLCELQIISRISPKDTKMKNRSNHYLINKDILTH